MRDLAPGHPEIERVLAPNPSPMTLEGTNTYLYGADPCVVIDPGPDDEAHLEAVLAVAEDRGGIGVVLLTHSHGDHSDGADRLGAEVVLPGDGDEHSGLRSLATPGHAEDHVVLLTADGVCFSGDLILGHGSTFVPPGGGSLIAYMRSLHAVREEGPSLICPGHGPWVTDPVGKLEEYIGHRQMREDRLVAALERGERSRAALLAEVWDDVPEQLIPAAAVTMDSHLEKLTAEDRLPGGELEE